MKYEINWEKYWLNENGYLLWLITGMKSENKKIRSLSYGILANIIPYRGSYKYICLQAPQFIDLAFELLIESKTDKLLKKELISVINNFLVSFDDKIYKNYSYNTNGIEEVNNIVSSSPLGFIDENQQKQLEILFIKSGFFTNLKSLLNNHDNCIAYKVSFLELLLNIVQKFKNSLVESIINQELWEDLLSYLIIPLYNISSKQNERINYTLSYQLQYYYQSNYDSIYLLIYTALKFLLIILYDNEELEYKLTTNTSLVSKLHNIFIFINAYLCGYSISENSIYTERIGNNKLMNIRKLDKFQCQIIRLSCLLLGNSIQQCMKNSEKLVYIKKTYMVPVVQISLINTICEMVVYQNGLENKKAAIYLLARLLSYYYESNTSIKELNDLLNNNIIHHYGCSVGYYLCREIYSQLISDNYNNNDVYKESLYISLKLLLMYCQSAKNYIIEDNVCFKLFNKINKLKENYKFSEINQKKIALYVSILRFALLDSKKIKEIVYHLNINVLLVEFLLSKKLFYNILYEVLIFEKNLITNYSLAKKSLFDNQRSFSNEYGNSVVSLIINLLNKDDLKIEIFELIIEIFISLVVSFDSRIYLIK
eukprot:jgi/Orpsp1_1/1187536/evm.model.d7180000058451.1